MNSLGPFAPKLAPLVRMLGSPVDGEALAACRALGRTLNGAGLDFHWLAATVERAVKPKRRRKKPAPEAEPEPEFRPWQSIAQKCLHRGVDRLCEVELDFLRSTATWPSEPSDKQARWLEAIAVSLNVEMGRV